jgi:hypothetical protein
VVREGLHAEAVEAPRFTSSTVTSGLSASGELNRVLHLNRDSLEQHMHATIRRYEGVDTSRTNELTKKVDETLMPRLSKLPGFEGYYLIEAGNGVMSSVGIFDNSAQADESTRVTATWVREEKLETALPNPPKITGGEVIVHKANGLVRA